MLFRSDARYWSRWHAAGPAPYGEAHGRSGRFPPRQTGGWIKTGCLPAAGRWAYRSSLPPGQLPCGRCWLRHRPRTSSPGSFQDPLTPLDAPARRWAAPHS